MATQAWVLLFFASCIHLFTLRTYVLTLNEYVVRPFKSLLRSAGIYSTVKERGKKLK